MNVSTWLVDQSTSGSWDTLGTGHFTKTHRAFEWNAKHLIISHAYEPYLCRLVIYWAIDPRHAIFTCRQVVCDRWCTRIPLLKLSECCHLRPTSIFKQFSTSQKGWILFKSTVIRHCQQQMLRLHKIRWSKSSGAVGTVYIPAFQNECSDFKSTTLRRRRCTLAHATGRASLHSKQLRMIICPGHKKTEHKSKCCLRVSLPCLSRPNISVW